MGRSDGDELRSLGGATAWLNTPPLTAAALRGRVVVVQFWTFTCINWLRTMPYVRGWADRYGGRGAVMLGVHTPEFTFEHDVDNVRRAVQEMRIGYPVAIDNHTAVWRGFGNRYWPALYVVDAQGRVRHRHFGEGGYAESEGIIQRLLTEVGGDGFGRVLVSPEARGAEVAADWWSLRSPETYVGYERTAHFASGDVSPDQPHVYTAPAQLALNHWALSGEWTVKAEPIVLDRAGGRIAYRFHARDLHLVMGPAARDARVRFRVRLDGQAPGAAHGADVDDRGAGVAGEQRLYQLVRQPTPIGDRLFEIEFLDPGVEAFAFTFG